MKREFFGYLYAQFQSLTNKNFFPEFLLISSAHIFSLMVPENFDLASFFVNKMTSRDSMAAYLRYFVLFTRIFDHKTTKNYKSEKIF